MSGLSQKLDMRQGQSLVMTPQLQQAIKLLQLSNIELAEFVEGELERNPLLERDDRNEESGPERTDQDGEHEFDLGEAQATVIRFSTSPGLSMTKRLDTSPPMLWATMSTRSASG